MKRFAVAVLLMIPVCFSLFSCSDKPVEPRRPLVGNWRWLQSCGGLAYHCEYADSVDYWRSIDFGYNYDFTEWRYDSLYFSGKYRLIRKPVWGGDTADVVVIDGYSAELIVDYERNDSLSLTEYCADCFTSIYLKLGPI